MKATGVYERLDQIIKFQGEETAFSMCRKIYNNNTFKHSLDFNYYIKL